MRVFSNHWACRQSKSRAKCFAPEIHIPSHPVSGQRVGVDARYAKYSGSRPHFRKLFRRSNGTPDTFVSRYMTNAGEMADTVCVPEPMPDVQENQIPVHMRISPP
eukprot:TRINITY_DN1705_c0_g1_i7.p2 TRINITY_DN1705_c0_g1~~TRINITY_DN1705_c0_g1_i7.p2  ORF type:complete len:105 (+),score=7.59 TRINITY_DN1705_c0_g1_i7:36-350(+)